MPIRLWYSPEYVDSGKPFDSLSFTERVCLCVCVCVCPLHDLQGVSVLSRGMLQSHVHGPVT